ncbi:MAG: hypothetical protein IPP74_10155 [Alphaproteobacteria bacterium]|nr:hypothetical protein [Alphaproteobacteria bacterium]
MAQHDYVLSNQAGAPFRSDLNDALAAAVSNNSGTTAPTTTVAYMLWYDTTLGLLKIRNGANNAWVTIGPLADSSKHEIYVSNAVKVTVNSSGYMGINDTTPSYHLDVNGDINFTGTLRQNGTAFTAAPDSITEGNTSVEVSDSGSNGVMTVTVDGTERMRVSNAGEFLLNTTSPVTNAIATITKSSTALNMLAIGNTGTYLKLGSNDSGSDYQAAINGTAFIYTSNGVDIVLGTGAVETCRLKNSDGTLTFASGKYPVAKNVPKAWVNFSDGFAFGGLVINDSFNVSSVTNPSSNTYRIYFTNAMNDNKYCPSAMISYVSSKAPIVLINSLTTSYIEIVLQNGTSSLNSSITNLALSILGA